MTGSVLPGENTLIWVLWITYGSFYFCRINISAAVPGMQEELGFTKAEIGMILGALKLTYGVGQLVNGLLAERYSARLMLAVGMLCSALINCIFGFFTALYFLLFVWACNGYFQALGWTPVVRVAANWVPVRRRGKAIGIIGTGYQFTAALTFVIAGFSAEWLGWRGALYIPAILLAASALHMLVFLKETPGEAARRGEKEEVASKAVENPASKGSFFQDLKLTLSNPALWFLAVALGLLNACRYGFLDWGLTHLKEVQKTGVGIAALKYAVLPLGGIAGAYLAGWATDRYFASRRAPVVCILLLVLGLLTLFYEWVARTSLTGTIAILLVIGFVIYGPQVLLVGTAPADLAKRGTAAAAAGFVNFMGYIGAYAGVQFTGYLVDLYGWRIGVFFWAACAFTAAATVALLWNATSRE